MSQEKLKRLLFVAIIFCKHKLGASDPETFLINEGCSQYNVSNLADFNSNLNATFAELRKQLDAGKYFATAEQPRGSDSAYAMVQCRKYMSSPDCIACFTVAESRIRNCSAANGARVINLGCSLRYESSSFFTQSTQEGRFGFCGNQTASQTTAFQAAATELFQDLQVATPKVNGFFAAGKKAIGDGDNKSSAVYGIAQCVETISEEGCRECLRVAYGNLERCLTFAFGWAVDVGCFLRYSDTPFFNDNQTTDIAPFLKSGKRPALVSVFVTIYY